MPSKVCELRIRNTTADDVRSSLQPALDHYMQKVLLVPQAGDGTGALLFGTLLLGVSTGSQLATARNTGKALERAPSVRYPSKGNAELSLPNNVRLDVAVVGDQQGEVRIMIRGEHNWLLGPSEKDVETQITSLKTFFIESLVEFQPKQATQVRGGGLVDELERLAALRKSDLISADEYEQVKASLLGAHGVS